MNNEPLMDYETAKRVNAGIPDPPAYQPRKLSPNTIAWRTLWFRAKYAITGEIPGRGHMHLFPKPAHDRCYICGLSPDDATDVCPVCLTVRRVNSLDIHLRRAHLVGPEQDYYGP